MACLEPESSSQAETPVQVASGKWTRGKPDSRRLSEKARNQIIDRLSPMRGNPTWQKIRFKFSDIKFNECEALIGLTQPDEDFRSAIVDAVFMALCLNRASPIRPSDLRKDRELVAARATAAADAVEKLTVALSDAFGWPLSSDLPEPLVRLTAPETIEILRELADAAQRDAESVPKDAGGRPKNTSFRIFILMLGDAFGRATGQRAAITCNPVDDRYQGRFWELVNRVLSVAEGCVGDFAPKTESARGKYIQRVLARMDKTPTPSTE